MQPLRSQQSAWRLELLANQRLLALVEAPDSGCALDARHNADRLHRHLVEQLGAVCRNDDGGSPRGVEQKLRKKAEHTGMNRLLRLLDADHREWRLLNERGQ